ncbi:MAG: hypothetical protein QX197_10900 [Methylococcaceae bacterium]
MKPDDVEFLSGMVLQLNETINRLVLEEFELSNKIGVARVEELLDYWEQRLSPEEEIDLKRTMDYWDKILIQTWANLNRAHNSRAEVGKTFMKLNSKL